MRRAFYIWVSFTLIIVVIEACAGRGAARPDGPHFTHAAHIDRGLECADCHGDADVGFAAMPTLETCNECHEEIDAEAPADKRATAFFDAEGRPKWLHVSAQKDEIIFDHKAHGARDKTCLSCHENVATTDVIPADAQMSMGRCIECHETQAPTKNDCASCHERIRKDVAPRSHRLGWTVEHGRHARMGRFDPMPTDCSMCHTRSSCDECHHSQAPRTHNNLFRRHGHAALASMDRQSCTTCHQPDTCDQCHESVLPRSHRGGFGAPFNHHCNGCHLPADQSRDEGCGVCHRSTSSHETAPPRPINPAHMTTNSAACRACHTPMPHADNGQSCLLCHR